MNMRICQTLLFVISALAVALGCSPSTSPAANSSVTTTPVTRPSESERPHKLAARRADMDLYISKWFEAHGHSDVVMDDDGVGVRGNATRLRASLYSSKPQKDGNFLVDVEFTIRLPTNREIREFVPGMGKSEDAAINEALVNFTLTTFHVVYKGFINDADPHMKVRKLEINGAQRAVIMGDILSRGGGEKNIDLNPMRTEVLGALKGLLLTEDAHWIKIVYSQNAGKPMTVAVTMDNEDHNDLTNAVTKMPWPRSDSFYMAKQVIVIK